MKPGREEKKSFHFFNTLGFILHKHIFFSRLRWDELIIILFHVLNHRCRKTEQGQTAQRTICPF